MKLRQLTPLFLILVWILAGCVAPPAQPAAMTSEEQASLPSTSVSAEETAAEHPTGEAVDEGQPPVDLFAGFSEPSATIGDVVILYGRVLDVNDAPVPGATVEIWQTDAGGVYDHPRDPGTADRDTTFQFYGAATAEVDGWYAFRTIVPGEYEPRPRHIHFKVKQGGATLLTSQFYFSDDIAEVEDEGMFRAVGESGDQLLLQLVQGESGLLAYGEIVVDTGVGSGALPLTPSQGEGPYYPVSTVAEFDNDLVRLP